MLLPEKMLWTRPTKNNSQKEGGYIYYDQPFGFYYPFDVNNLPNYLAKVIDEKGALNFVNKYGYLGYRNFFDDEEFLKEELYPLKYGEYCDPIEWFLLQSNTLRFVLYLIKAIQEEKEIDVNSLVKEKTTSVSRRIPNKDETETREFLKVAIGPKEGMILSPFEKIKDLPVECGLFSDKFFLNYVKEAIAQIINLNSESVRRLLVYKQDESFPRPIPEVPFRVIPQFYSNSLIESIWHMTGDIFISSQEKGGNEIRICEDCGSPFIVFDKRQRFCPGDEFSQTSLCGARQRMRKHRKEANK